MKNDYTHISIVLDRSGSMSAIRDDTIGGFNEFLKRNQAAPGQCTLTLVQFDSTAVETLHDGKPIAAVPPLTQDTYQPRDSTPLYDAVGQTIVRTGDFLHHMAEFQRPSKVIFVIITDGMENASVKFNSAQVRDMIKHQREAYKWEFVFLGANIDSYAVSQSLNISAKNTMNYAANEAGTQAMYHSLASNTVSLRCSTADSMAFNEADIDAQAVAGALPNPPKKKAK